MSLHYCRAMSVPHRTRRSFTPPRSFLLVLLLAAITMQAGVAQPRPAPPQRSVGARPGTPPKPAGASLKPVSESPVVSRRLANGLEVLVYEDHSVPLVTVEYSAAAGPAVETPEENGYSHLVEHMFWKFNPATMKLDYARNIGQLGINYNGTTREEQCTEYFTGTSENFVTILHFLSDMVRHPRFTAEDLEQEKKVVLGEIDRNEANPFNHTSLEMTRLLFFKHPWTRNPGGTRQNVQQANAERLQAFFVKHWAPTHSAIVIAGDVAAEQAFARTEEFFGDWTAPPDDSAPQPIDDPPLPGSDGLVQEELVNNVMVQIGWQGPSLARDSRATYAADVFSFILRQPQSRFQRTMIDSGLANGLNLGYYTQRSAGPISAVMLTTPDKARAALAALKNEINHFADPDYFTDQQLENAKTLLAADDLYSREKPSEYAHTLSFWATSAGVTYWKSYLPTLATVSRADITRYLKTYITGRPRITLVLLSSEAEKKLQLKREELAR